MPTFSRARGKPGISSQRGRPQTAGGITSEQSITPSPVVEEVSEPRLSNDELTEKLNQSGQAVQEVKKYQELERQAAEHKPLQIEQAKRIAKSKAKQQYVEDAEELTAEANEIKKLVAEVNAEIAQLEPRLNALAELFKTAEKRKYDHFEKSVLASSVLFRASGHKYDHNLTPLAQKRPDSVGDFFKIVGDVNALRTISTGKTDRPIAIALQHAYPGIFPVDITALRRLCQAKGG